MLTVFCIFSVAMRGSSNRRNRSASFVPNVTSVSEFRALPKQSLILMASARNLVTTGTKGQVSQRIFEHVHERGNPRRSITSATPVSIEENTAQFPLLARTPTQFLRSSKQSNSHFRVGSSINYANSLPRLLVLNIVAPSLAILTQIFLFFRRRVHINCSKNWSGRESKMASLQRAPDPCQRTRPLQCPQSVR